jgi:integrase/recombinase XerD
MNPSTQVVSPLRQRMIEDMRLRKLNGKTQIAYVRAVRGLAGFLRRSPDTATGEDLRRFQLHMVDQGTSSMTINATISGLRFFFEITLECGELMAMMSPVREPRKLPVVLPRPVGLPSCPFWEITTGAEKFTPPSVERENTVGNVPLTP